MRRTPDVSTLLMAFRQAKRAFATERTTVGSSDFARFEIDLDSRLARLQSMLRDGQWFSQVPMGELLVVPKDLERPASSTQSTDRLVRIGHSLDTSISRAMSVRLQLSPTPEFATVEVLYLWAFGPSLEALLDTSCVGYRLKRVARDGTMDRSALDVYEHWPSAFERYRDDPVATARDILRSSGRAIVTSTDVVSFFDSIDPSFMLDPMFVKRLTDATARHSRPLDVAQYTLATRSLLDVYARFRKSCRKFCVSPSASAVGIPIGSMTSRLVANVALAPLDRYIQRRPSIELYRRYVDDIVVVQRSAVGEDVPTSKSDVLAQLFPNLTSSGLKRTFVVPETGGVFQLKESKTRIHDLVGESGREFLASVGQSFALATSERRAMLGNSERLAAEIEAIDLFSDVGAADHIPRLRDADRFTLRRFVATAFVRSVERYALLLDRRSATKFVRRRVSKVLAALESADLVENLEIVMSLFRIAVLLSDAHLRDQLWAWLRRHIDALKTVSKVTWCDEGLVRERSIRQLEKYLLRRRDEALWSSASYSLEPDRRVRRKALLLRRADLRHLDRDDDVAMFGRPSPLAALSQARFAALSERLSAPLRTRIRTIAMFLARHAQEGDDAWKDAHALSALLASRPPTYAEVARRMLRRIVDGGKFSNKPTVDEVVDALRGTRFAQWTNHARVSRDSRGVTVHLGSRQPKMLRVVVANLPVENEDFVAAARGEPRATARRLELLDIALREARRATVEAKRQGIPSILLMPELSIPRRVERALVRHANEEEIALVAGLEYQRSSAGVWNEAIGIFPLERKRAYSVTWAKLHPARKEASVLAAENIPFCTPSDRGRLVVDSGLGRIGVLICSEILESEAIARLTGRVEVVLVPAWNPDTSTFEHVARSIAEMLVHSFVAIANNAEASDSRIVSPIDRPRYLRDCTRIIQRGESRVVWADIPTGELRQVHDGDRPASRGSASSISFRPLPPGWPSVARRPP